LMESGQVTQTRTNTVFISHGGPDGEFARWLYDGLSKVGIVARLDQVEVELGDNVIHWMNDAIRESDYLLLLLSPRSLDRYWVRLEWAAALMKEAELRRTFVIPAVMSGLTDAEIPELLKPKVYLDFRSDAEQAFMKLVARLKDDRIYERKTGRLPSPAPSDMREQVMRTASGEAETIEIVVHSNRFARTFRLTVPWDATPSYLLSILRETLGLTFSNVDEKLHVALTYTYYLKHDGDGLVLNRSLRESGVKNGDCLNLWIQVTLQDLLEGKELTSLPEHLRPLHVLSRKSDFHLDAIISPPERHTPRSFSAMEIGEIAKRFFQHVDE